MIIYILCTGTYYQFRTNSMRQSKEIRHILLSKNLSGQLWPPMPSLARMAAADQPLPKMVCCYWLLNSKSSSGLPHMPKKHILWISRTRNKAFTCLTKTPQLLKIGASPVGLGLFFWIRFPSSKQPSKSPSTSNGNKQWQTQKGQ